MEKPHLKGTSELTLRNKFGITGYAMSKAIEEHSLFEESRNLMHLADAHTYFLRRYAKQFHDDRDRYEFERDLNHLIHLTYREAQTPLTKQMSEFLITNTRPLLFTKELK